MLEKKLKLKTKTWKLTLAIPTGAPIILANEIIDTPLLVAIKTIKVLSI